MRLQVIVIYSHTWELHSLRGLTLWTACPFTTVMSTKLYHNLWYHLTVFRGVAYDCASWSLTSTPFIPLL